MSKNHRIIVILTLLFFTIFSGMVMAGIDLTYRSVKNKKTTKITVKIKASKDNAEIDVETAIPGIILIVLGSVGLFLMVIKVPTKELIGFKSRQGSSENVMSYSLGMFNTSQEPIYSQKITNIPWPIWWLIKRKGVFTKVGEST